MSYTRSPDEPAVLWDAHRATRERGLCDRIMVVGDLGRTWNLGGVADCLGANGANNENVLPCFDKYKGLEIAGWSCSSITFIATSTTGSVSFADASTMDVVPSYGPYLDNVSLDARYVIADIDVDSNNDGSINKFDDPIETGSAGVSPASIETGSAGVSPAIESGQFGKIALMGDTFTVNLNQISNASLDPSRFGARISGGSGVVTYSQPTLSQKFLTATASTAGQATLVYEIYSLATGAIVSTDSVLITVNTPPHLRAHKDDAVICESSGYKTGDYSTLAEIFHDANDTKSITTIDLNSYFHDSETPDQLTYTLYSQGNSQLVLPSISGPILNIQFTDQVGQTEIVVQATDPCGASESWTIDLYNVRVAGYEIEESVLSLGWRDVEDAGSDWSLHWMENDYQWTPILESDIGKDRVTELQWHSVPWATRMTAEYGNVFATANWSTGSGQTQAQFLTDNWSLEEGTLANIMTEGEYAIIPKLTFDSIESSSLLTQSTIAFLNWKSLGTSTPSGVAPRIGKVGIDSVNWIATTCVMTENPTDNGGGKRIFPEKSTPTDNLKNQIGVRILLTSNVPSGMRGFVSLVLLDPMNQCSDSASNSVGTESNDNNGRASLAVSSNTYDPGSGAPTPAWIRNMRTVVEAGNIVSDMRYVNILQANAGDNYIVAAHPNSDAEPFIAIGTTTPAKDHAVYIVDGNTTYAQQTDLLTIWRTLWVEQDQLTFTVPHSTGDPVVQIPGTTVAYNPGYIWNELVYTVNRVLLTGLPEQELARACIDLKEYPINAQCLISSNEYTHPT